MHRRPRSKSPSAPACALLPLVLATSCDGCPSSKPYTPFTLDTAPPSGSPPPLSGARRDDLDASADAADAAAAPAPFAVIEGAPAPEGGKRWPLDGGGGVVDVIAPMGRAFETGLLIDGDGDGARDLIAWARAPDGLRGELLLAPGGGKPQAPRTLAALPADLSGPGCTPRVGLRQIGPTTVTFDFAPQCGQRRHADATRWIAVFRLPAAGAGATPELVLELRLRTPPPDEALSATLDAADRDGDGRDDLTVSLGLAGALRPFPAPPAAAPELRVPLVFLDRPGGLSRDPSQPGEALRAAATGLLREARSKATAPAVAGAAARLRRLHALACADAGGEPASSGHDAALAGVALVAAPASAGPVRCGEASLSASIDYAEAIAAATAGAPLAGVAALDHGEGARTKDADKLLARLAPAAVATVVHRTAAAPLPGRSRPLAFEPGGDLLVRTAEGVVRVDHAGFGEAAADVPAWSPAFTAGPAELVAVERRCDTPTLIALVRTSPDAVGEMEVPLPLLRSQGPRAPSPWRCAGTERIPFSPLGASERGFDLAVGAALLTIDLRAAAPTAAVAPFPAAQPAPPSPGVARSPDGATIAVPAAGGLLVATAGGAARLWTGGELGQAQACVPANGGARVACASGGAAVIHEAK